MMKQLLPKTSIILLFFTTLIFYANAQKQTQLDVALRYVEQQHEKWQLTDADVADMAVNDSHTSKHNHVTHFYFMQRHASIPVHNAIMGVHVTKDRKVGFATNRFVSDLANKINAVSPRLSPKEAIVAAAQALALPNKAKPDFSHKTETGVAVFEDANISRVPIKVRLMYQPMEDGSVRLAWDLAIHEITTPDYWSVRIDALNGDLLSRDNWTVHCTFPDHRGSAHENCVDEAVDQPSYRPVQEALLEQNLPPVDGARYNVFPAPIENPMKGERQMVVNPADTLASPFGWHDTDGEMGADFTITRGNNVHSFADTQGNNLSNQNEPDGGVELVFDFPFDDTQEPATYRDAATTQLFYMNNFMHDFAYHYGFDEQAGNFQANNYDRGNGTRVQDPTEGDYVVAHAQDGGDENNANFATPPDGESGTMQMYLWSAGGGGLFKVDAPEIIAGGYEVGTADFGPEISEQPLTGKVVAALSADNNPSLACGAIVNADEVAGNVALVDRGECFFEEKTANAEAAGAIAVIICNFENTTIPMGGVGTIQDPDIPTVMMTSSDCQLIRQYLDGEVTVTLQEENVEGPVRLDGSFDNGIVAHEYAHGISLRLTGGASTSSCLSNAEQMGEGWSDFFTLVTTVQAGDNGSDPRGIANYVFDRSLDGKGVRRVPYSTDLNVNNQTYEDVIGASVPHGVGEIWAGVLWDLYWKFVDVYGWDEDIYNGTGGNNMAIQLVMDGMKLQSCNPGYLDGRDAILAADLLNNDGANQCLIWEVFARRGLGWSADQGNAFNANDALAGFDVMPECVKELKIVKEATPLIDPGDEITYTLTVTNHKDNMATNVLVTDIIPENTNFIAGSMTGAFAFEVENGVIQVEIGDMPAGSERTITYRVATPADQFSIQQFYDDMENGYTNWTFDALDGTDIWDIAEAWARSGTQAWYVPNTNRANDQVFGFVEPFLVTGDFPVLRFYHRYDTDPGLDGGIVQVSTDGGANWATVEPELFRNGYFGRISYFAFSLPDTRAFWGNSNGFIGSYVDLRPYLGEDILVRFRFGSDEEPQFGGSGRGTGWAIDDIEVMDMRHYQTEACVTSDENDQACDMPEEGGTIVESAVLTSTDEPRQPGVKLSVYPNPASDFVNLSIRSPKAADADISLYNANGKLVQSRRINLAAHQQVLPLNVSALANGLYFIEVRTESGVFTEKIVIQ